MRIEPERVVTIDYLMYDQESSALLESSRDDGPLVYLHGFGELPDGLEDALEGKEAGEKVHVVLAPEDAYGEHEEELVQAVPREQFDGMDDLAVGMTFEAETEEGPRVVRVVGFEGDDVIIDGNERYAGRTVRFDVTVLGVREATAEELEHGHVHDDGDCTEEDEE
jgi:FKBP-type peptidyl-prolyl cis-trans isomerase SlyD